MAAKTTIKKNEHDEYEVRFWNSGQLDEAKTYYTDDREDANSTKQQIDKHIKERTCKTCGAYIDETNYCDSCGGSI
jgi:hypothetical protein